MERETELLVVGNESSMFRLSLSADCVSELLDLLCIDCIIPRMYVDTWFLKEKSVCTS